MIHESNSNCNFDAGNTMSYNVPGAHPSANSLDIVIPVRTVFEVTPGTYTYYLNGISIAGASSGDRFWYADIMAQFFPD